MNQDDLIRRQDAINAITEVMDELIDGETISEYLWRDILIEVPSAEQTTKVRPKKDESIIELDGRCLNCGKEVRRRDNYCSRCGCKLEWE